MDPVNPIKPGHLGPKKGCDNPSNDEKALCLLIGLKIATGWSKLNVINWTYFSASESSSQKEKLFLKNLQNWK